MGIKKYALKVIYLLLLVGFMGVVGCMAPIHTLAPDFDQKKPQSIALMPVLNETNDLDGPKIILPMIYKFMLNKGYQLRNPQEVTALLEKENIHDAGQMFTLTYPEMGKLLDADALLYCTITEWRSLYLVVYSSVDVEAKFELIDAASGSRIWESTYKSSKVKAGLDKESLKENLMNAIRSPYEPQAQAVIIRTLSTLPDGPNATKMPRVRGCLTP